MKSLLRTLMVAALGLTASCEKNPAPTGKPAVSTPAPASGVRWKDADFTIWMSRAELQFLQENNPPDRYFAYVEGRSIESRSEYRAVVKPFNTGIYEQWAVFWGITEAELFDWELQLLKAGFKRNETQLFLDPSGTPRHQIVWLKENGGESEPGAATEEAVAERSLPAEQAPVLPPPQPELVDAVPLGGIPEPDLPVAAMPEPEPEPAKIETVVHVVRPGDTLGKIAKQRGTTVAEIRKLNQLRGDLVRIGQKLEVPGRR